MTAWLLGLAGALVAVPRPRLVAIRLARVAAARGLTADRPAPFAAVGVRRRASSVLSAGRARTRTVAVVGALFFAVVLELSGVRAGAAAAVGLLIAVVLDSGLSWCNERDARHDRVAIAQALTILESELVAGAREDAALTAAAAVAGRSAVFLREAAAGVGSSEHVETALARSSLLRPLASAWRVRHACGAPVADVVGQVARDVELRRARDLAVDAALTGPRSSAALLAALPVLGIGLGTVMGARPLTFLFGSTDGSIALLVGVGLDVAGWAWTGAMVRRARS